MHWPVLIACVAAYGAGSVPFGLLIGWSQGMDLRQHGSGNLGATNAVRVLGKKLGGLCFLCDVLKGLAPVAVSGALLGYLGRTNLSGLESWLWLAVGAAAVVGHVFPVWLKFKGGKGVATSLGVLLGFYPVLTLPALAGLATWITLAFVFRYVSLASVVAGLALPAYVIAVAWLRGMTLQATLPFAVVTGLLGVLVLVRHRGNLKRLASGTEPKIGQKKTIDPKQPSQEPPGE